jgi:5-methylcytosine-specific restriction endonuclease McrA
MGKGLNYKINVMVHAMNPLHMKWIVLFYMLCYIVSHSLLITTSNDNHRKEKNNGLHESWKNLQNLNIKSNNNKNLQTLEQKPMKIKIVKTKNLT